MTVLVPQRHYWDCFRACVATVFGLSYENVPEFVRPGQSSSAPDDTGWRALLHDWLAERNLVLWEIGLHGDKLPMLMFGGHKIAYHFDPRGVWIASVKSPRFEGTHAIVMRGREVLWDPHPQRAMGHGGFRDALVFVQRGAG